MLNFAKLSPALALIAFLTLGCETESADPVESTGDEIEEAADDAADATEEAADEAEDEVDEAF